ncbi:hypothetical protein SLA_0934 [Streptomyces laurentii]|uniref:Uncharacterized protein n=1 Tax=Streptomyces laurentii TaxID=39478 RepID=A0A160NVG2_STRLU|nr:hypothetical protein SLA_0934 [Streptomyces laurentii]
MLGRRPDVVGGSFGARAVPRRVPAREDHPEALGVVTLTGARSPDSRPRVIARKRESVPRWPSLKDADFGLEWRKRALEPEGRFGPAGALLSFGDPLESVRA